ncbi:rnp domain containing protein [Niveomyces insectorum RCEF 264]|uniref:Rnp domain containing protein n=1 Tax=Niveomyces insectorum RCEF 264 TaxID=1081102 RepID=A0A168ADM6_9HYPO|nr:rnp domain containing protein [Niveomyces insectorum RCEF 264]
MSSSGAPGVSSPHPSLPARPPPSSAVSASSAPPSTYTPTVSAPPYPASASTTPTATYGPTAPPPTALPSHLPSTQPTTTYYGGATASASTAASAYASATSQPQQTSQPRLAYSRTYAPVGAGRGRGAGTGFSAGYNGTNTSNYNYNNAAYPQQPQTQQTYGPQLGPQAGPTTYGPQYGPSVVAAAPPHIRNPFPAPQPQYGRGGGGYAGQDGYKASSYASWQSGYDASAAAAGAGGAAGGYQHHAGAGRGASAGPGTYYGPAATPGGGAAMAASPMYAGTPVTYGPDGVPMPAAEGGPGAAQDGTNDGSQPPERHQTVYRSGGGKTWTDDTLLEWDPSHLRLFVGNLAGEVTDETLLKAFSRWKSVQKAAVKRDKWTKKSRGYGFVSFSDADDFFQAAKEMNGKYIGSHPVVVRKSKTDIKVSAYKDETNKRGKKGGSSTHAHGAAKPKSDAAAHDTIHGNNDNKKRNAGSGSDVFGKRDPYEPAMGPVSTGVHKHGKTKGGLKLLG